MLADADVLPDHMPQLHVLGVQEVLLGVTYN